MSVPDERTLESIIGAPVRSIEQLEPWAVARVELDGDPATVIVKWLRDNPEGFRVDPKQLDTEAAALRFVGGLGLCPRLIAYSPDDRILVLEDLAPRTPLAPHLVAGDDVARSGLISLVRACAALQGATVDRAAGWGADRDRAGHLAHTTWADTKEHLDRCRVIPTGTEETERARALALLAEPGPFHAFSNGDFGSNNFLVDANGSDGRIIDFETAGYRHALVDMQGLYVPVTMFGTIRDPTYDGVEDAYREALAPAVPEVTDDARFGRDLAAAALLFILGKLHRLPKMEARPVGEPSRVQMVSGLDAAAGVARRFNAWPELRGLVERSAQALRRHWPDTDVELVQDRYTWRDEKGAVQVYSRVIKTA